jgi:hypothetical protein
MNRNPILYRGPDYNAVCRMIRRLLTEGHNVSIVSYGNHAAFDSPGEYGIDYVAPKAVA